MNTQTIDRPDVLALGKNPEDNSIFQSQAHETTSGRYNYLSTGQIVDYIKNFGWAPVEANQQKSKKFHGFQKHLIKFEHPDYIYRDEKINLLLVNSHNGSSSMQFKLGVYRFACSNGLVIGEDFQTVKLRHVNVSYDDVHSALKVMFKAIPEQVENINTLKSYVMDSKQMFLMATDIMKIRFNDDYDKVAFSIPELLHANRKEDFDRNAWNVLNIIQEKVMKGSLEYVNAKGKTRKLREVRSIDKNLELNSKMFDIAMSYARN